MITSKRHDVEMLRESPLLTTGNRERANRSGLLRHNEPSRSANHVAGWHRHGHLLRRLATIGAATTLLVLLASSDALHAALLDLFEAADGLVEGHPVAGPAAFVLFAGASAMLAFLSSAALVPAALVAWGPVATMALLWLGWIVGGAASYSMARFLGRPALALLRSGRSLAVWEKRISQRTPFALVLLFQLAVPSEVPGLVLGLIRYPFRRYLLALMIGELPFAAGAVYLGESFLERQPLVLVALGMVGTLGSYAAFRALQRRLAGARAATAPETRDELPLSRAGGQAD
jgi:uncharacterized membrane protein YdjX (TVP38/TMEM64 family)